MCSLHKDLAIRALEIHEHSWVLILQAALCLKPYYHHSLFKLSQGCLWRGNSTRWNCCSLFFMQLVAAVPHLFEKLSKLVILQAHGHQWVGDKWGVKIRKLIHAFILGKDGYSCYGWECNPGLGVCVPGTITQHCLGKFDRFHKGEK